LSSRDVITAGKSGKITRTAVVAVVLLVFCAFALLVAGCREAGSQPKAALKKFLKTVSTEDASVSYQMLSSGDRKVLTVEAWSAANGKLSGVLANKNLHFIMADASVAGNKATVDVLVGDAADTTNAQDVKFLMVKEGNTWKVSYLETAAGPVRHVETGGGLSWSNVAFGSGSESTAKSIVYIIMFLAIYVFYAVCVQRIARAKGMKRTWFAWVPILGTYLAWKIAGKGVVSTILSFIPIVNIIMYVIFCFKISRACGKGRLYGLLQIIPVLNFIIFWLLLENVEGERLEAEPQPA
jgi:Family of unknown function (DUF5684)